MNLAGNLTRERVSNGGDDLQSQRSITNILLSPDEAKVQELILSKRPTLAPRRQSHPGHRRKHSPRHGARLRVELGRDAGNLPADGAAADDFSPIRRALAQIVVARVAARRQSSWISSYVSHPISPAPCGAGQTILFWTGTQTVPRGTVVDAMHRFWM
jgi:hypothetical protein